MSVPSLSVSLQIFIRITKQFKIDPCPSHPHCSLPRKLIGTCVIPTNLFPHTTVIVTPSCPPPQLPPSCPDCPVLISICRAWTRAPTWTAPATLSSSLTPSTSSSPAASWTGPRASFATTSNRHNHPYPLHPTAINCLSSVLTEPTDRSPRPAPLTMCGRPSTCTTLRSTRRPATRWSWLAGCRRRSRWTCSSPAAWWPSTAPRRPSSSGSGSIRASMRWSTLPTARERPRSATSGYQGDKLYI